LKQFENIGAAMGSSISQGLNNALNGFIQGFQTQLNNIAGVKQNSTSNINNITKNYNLSNHVSGNVSSPSVITQSNKKLLDLLELNGR